ncbi:HAMP domain-containing sensor histidine kinase [uncultured Imperialibacter sp.]|uniref:sensor histidine kinase n=1 Tax=uncultured Imperialibacter sp. TaxID=1672639 RepID=UPI0030D7098F|tara:strand:- start:19442 stop:20785 length:1344 start_codon:yes stop_codon:yes gene_type:complete
MQLSHLVDFFLHPVYFEQPDQLRKARLFVRGCLLTSLFSTSYVWLSVLFEYQKGVYFMVMNVVGFLLLPLLAKTRLPIALLGNLYVTLGATAVLVLTYFSGGIWSAIYPWIVSIPLLALLVVDKFSGAVWGGIALACMVYFGVLDMRGIALPVEYNVEMKTWWFTTILTGLLLIILFVGFVFEVVQTGALRELESKNAKLEEQKTTIASQSEALEKLIEEKDYIIRILAHDLRNPLSNIDGLADMMESKRYVGQEDEFLGMVKRTANNALHLIERVLEMDKADQRESIDMDPVDVAEVLQELIESINETARRKDIAIKLNNAARSTSVVGERVYVLQIFENLLSNAIKFSKGGTKVSITVANTNSSLMVKVADEGPGVRPEEEDRLFKKFSKLSSRPTGEESSAGLGLSLVKRYVELLGGKIWHEGGAAIGATFAVELPLTGRPDRG